MTIRAVERDLLIVVCAASAGIHAALTPEHLREEASAGAGFLGATALLASVCVALTRRPQSRTPFAAAAVALAGLLAAYGLAVTTGVPLLQPSPEPADAVGLATKAIELVGLVAALDLLAHGRPVVRHTRLRPKGTMT